MVGHRLMASSLFFTGDIAESRAHFDRAIKLYDPAEHHALATRFGQDVRVSVILSMLIRSVDAWLSRSRTCRRGASAQTCTRDRSSGHADVGAGRHSLTRIFCGNYTSAIAQSDEVVALADEKGALFWKVWGLMKSRLRIGLDWRGSRRSPHDLLRHRCMALNGSNSVRSVVPFNFGDGPRETRQIRRRLALH